MTPDRPTARDMLNRELDRIGRIITRAGQRDDDATAEVYCEALMAVHAERSALDRAQRRAR